MAAEDRRELDGEHADSAGAPLDQHLLAGTHLKLVTCQTKRGNSSIPLVRQLVVTESFRRLGVATLLMDAAEDLTRGRA